VVLLAMLFAPPLRPSKVIGEPPLTITADGQADRWRVSIGGSDPATLTIRAGAGTTPGHVREQIFNQFSGR